MEILKQLIGIMGAVLCVSSFQIKNNKVFFTMQALSGLLFAVNFFMLSAFTGAALNIVNMIRGCCFLVGKKNKPYWVLIGIWGLYAAATVLTYNGWLSILICVAQFVGTYAMFCGKPGVIRILNFTIVSPFWMLHNIVAFSLGGIMCEVFNMCSMLIFMLRYYVFDKNKIVKE